MRKEREDANRKDEVGKEKMQKTNATEKCGEKICNHAKNRNSNGIRTTSQMMEVEARCGAMGCGSDGSSVFEPACPQMERQSLTTCVTG